MRNMSEADLRATAEVCQELMGEVLTWMAECNHVGAGDVAHDIADDMQIPRPTIPSLIDHLLSEGRKDKEPPHSTLLFALAIGITMERRRARKAKEVAGLERLQGS